MLEHSVVSQTLAQYSTPEQYSQFGVPPPQTLAEVLKLEVALLDTPASEYAQHSEVPPIPQLAQLEVLQTYSFISPPGSVETDLKKTSEPLSKTVVETPADEAAV